MTKISYWIPVLVWAAVIFTFSSLTVHPSSEFYWEDFIVKKTAHLVEYALFFILIYRALINTRSENRRRLGWIALLVVFFYAISDEYHQSFTPGREPSLRDVVIDTTAGVLAWTAIAEYLPKAPKKLKNLAKSLQII